MSLSSAQASWRAGDRVFPQSQRRAARAGGLRVSCNGIDTSLCDVNSSYFLVHGRVQHERAVVDRTTLVWRYADPYDAHRARARRTMKPYQSNIEKRCV
jgi:general secretion pathway protein K